MGYQNYKRGILHKTVRIRPVGADGSASAQVAFPTGPCILRFLAVNYTNMPATTDLTIEAGDGGDVLFTASNTNTDIVAKPVTMTAGVDETGAALAATDGSAGGMPSLGDLTVNVAQADTGSATDFIDVDVWYEPVEHRQVTLFPVGADGSAAVSRRLRFARAGVVRAIKVNYTNQPATTDLVIKGDVLDDGSGGTTLLTLTNVNTDIALSPVGMPAVNESNAATAATDATDGGWPFKKNLFIDVAQGDGGGVDNIVVDLFVE
jgi:hypothetical protein